MREEAQKTLGDLYAIRATMSLVAQNDDEAAPDRREIDKINREIDGCRRATENEKKRMQQDLKQYEIGRNIEHFVKQREITEEKHKNARDAVNRNKGFLKYKCYIGEAEKNALIVLAIVGAVCGAIVLGILIPGMNNPDWNVDGGLIVAVFFPVTFGWIIVGSCIIVPRIRKEYRRMEEDLRRSQANEQKYRIMLKGINDKLEVLRKKQTDGEEYVENSTVQKAKKRLQVETEKYNDKIIELQGLIPQREVTIKELAVQSKALVESAIKAYPVIDFRDWANVDLLIYYFETGRADSMKEALQLVDRQRQTDQITQALALASAEISRTIHQSMMQLGNALAQSFSVLSAQLAAQHNEVMQGMEEQAARQRAEIGRQTAAIERQSAMQVSAQEMNAALLNKISTSSGHLAEQMDRQMREVYHIYP